MKKIISLLLTTAMVFTSVSAFAKDYPQKFWDVPKDHWAFEYVADLADRGVIDGYEDGSFKPESTVTRAEWAKIMVDAAGVAVNDNSVNFTDTSNHWANKYVNAAKNYLTGYTDGSYRPNQAAVREDVTVAMVKLKGYDLADVDYSVLSKFTDNDSISAYAKGYVAVAISKDLIDGFEDNTFRGQATLTRAEAATLLYRAFQKGSNDKIADISQAVQTAVPTAAPKATAKPAVPTEKPSQTSAPTVKPTEKPTPEPTEEPTPEPTEAPRPYAIDTVVKANVGGYLQYTKDNDDNIYYKENNSIYKTNIYEKNKDKIIDGSDIVIDNDEMTLSDFKITSVCYDNCRSKILITGSFKTVNYAGVINNSYLCSVSEGEFEVITDSLLSSSGDFLLVKVLDNGDYAVMDTNRDTAIIAADTLKYSYLPDTAAIITDIFDSGTELYATETNGSFNYYDYSTYSERWRNNDACLGISEDIVAVGSSNGMEIRNFKGKTLKSIRYDDMAVFDRTAIDFSKKIRPKMLITNNDDIVFYDISSNAFRILKENL